MGKAERYSKIEKLEKALDKSKVICYLTSDRTGLEGPSNYITKDAVKVIEQHLGAETGGYESVALYLMSHGGDMDVPWPLVNLLRSRYKNMQVIVPYICHSAATSIALGADTIVAGPRAQLSPTDPMLTVKTGSEENAPTMQFGVEDINAFLEFVKNSMGEDFKEHGHEAMTKLMDRIKPEWLGSVNRTYRRSKLLIEKMRGLTKTKYSQQEMESLINYLTVAYFAHGHCISRNEMMNELKLPVTPAEKLGIDGLIWELYEEYAEEFHSREPFDIQKEFHNSTANPAIIETKTRFVESLGRTDVFVQTMKLQGTGAPSFNFTVPPNLQVDQAVLKGIVDHFLKELNAQVKPFQTAKKIASFGEWRSE